MESFLLIVLLDIGNTRVAVRRGTKTNYYLHKDFFKTWPLKREDQVYAASVVSSVSDRLKKRLKNRLKLFSRRDIPLVIKAGQGCGIDRLLNAVGGASRFPQENLLIIDLGSAITVDFIKSNKTFLGGWIAPGQQTLSAGLSQNTSALFPAKIQSRDLKLEVGTTTRQALVLGRIKMIEGLILKAKEQAMETFEGSSFRTLMTGGDAPLFDDGAAHHFSSLIFEGMECLLSKT